MRRLMAVMLVLAVALLSSHDRSSAQTTRDPASFALSAADFPPGSQIVESEVASNEEVAFRHLQIGPPLPAGRTTGYYMQARSYDSAGKIRLVVSYLVSLYTTADTADAAFNGETEFWRGLVGAGAQVRPLDADLYGEPGRQHWFAFSSASGDTHSELFFRRGSVFVQMNLDTYGSGTTPLDVDAFLAMAHTLDVVAGRPATTSSV